MIEKLGKFPGASASKKGTVQFDGADLAALARKHGTPLYVMSETLLRENCRAYRKAFEAGYPKTVRVLYASKAQGATAVLAIARQEGLGVDVASPGELHGALKAGFSPDDIFYHGNFKKREALDEAARKGKGRIRVVLDSLDEALELDRAARKAGVINKALLRVTPGIEAHTHEMIQTGKLDTKFGVSIHGGAALETIAQIVKLKSLDFTGFHYHLGSQIQNARPFTLGAERAARFMAELRDGPGVRVRELNTGGGYPIRYMAGDPAPSAEKYGRALTKKLLAECKRHNLEVPDLFLEPGRSIAGGAGATVYRVGPIKTIPGVRNYLSVDGGLSDNPRPALYGAKYEAVLVERLDRPGRKAKYRICGAHCESDVLFDDVPLTAPETGDFLAVFSTGAYNHSMASNYNRFLRLAIVLVRKGRAETIVERESLEALFSRERVPPRLK